jgi:hypothetical protein
MIGDEEHLVIALYEYIRVCELCADSIRGILGIGTCARDLLKGLSQGKEVQGIPFQQLEELQQSSRNQLQELKKANILKEAHPLWSKVCEYLG